jgi:hypothetical protein
MLDASGQEHVVRAGHHADHRLERRQVPDLSRLVARLLEDLSSRRRLRGFVVFEQPARQLVVPDVRNEAVAPAEQDVLAVVADDHSHRRRRHRHGVMLEVPSRRELDLRQAELDPLALVDRPHAEHLSLVACRRLDHRDRTFRSIGGSRHRVIVPRSPTTPSSLWPGQRRAPLDLAGIRIDVCREISEGCTPVSWVMWRMQRHRLVQERY